MYINPNANVEDQTPPPDLSTSAPLVIPPGATADRLLPRGRSAGVGPRSRSDHALSVGRRRAGDAVHGHRDRSSVSRIGLEGIPPNDVTPAHVRYPFTLNADAHVIMDYSVRVRDHNGKLAKPADKNLYVNPSATLAPPVTPPTP